MLPKAKASNNKIPIGFGFKRSDCHPIYVNVNKSNCSLGPMLFQPNGDQNNLGNTLASIQ